MTTRTLDRRKPFGEIFGVHELGAVYEQFGYCFNGAGEQVGGPSADAKKASAKPSAAAGDGEEVGTTEASLKDLHAAQVKKLVEEAGLTPFGGQGAKAKNIQLLLDNPG